VNCAAVSVVVDIPLVYLVGYLARAGGARLFSRYEISPGCMQDTRQIKVGVLGATGTVGQRFITLLASHPWFVVTVLGASPRSANKAYYQATQWKQSTPIPPVIREMVVKECLPEHFTDCALVFSGLDADVAGDIGQS